MLLPSRLSITIRCHSFEISLYVCQCPYIPYVIFSTIHNPLSLMNWDLNRVCDGGDVKLFFVSSFEFLLLPLLGLGLVLNSTGAWEILCGEVPIFSISKFLKVCCLLYFLWYFWKHHPPNLWLDLLVLNLIGPSSCLVFPQVSFWIHMNFRYPLYIFF